MSPEDGSHILLWSLQHRDVAGYSGGATVSQVLVCMF